MNTSPIAEQRRIVAKVEQLMPLLDALKTQLANSRATALPLRPARRTDQPGSIYAQEHSQCLQFRRVAALLTRALKQRYYVTSKYSLA